MNRKYIYPILTILAVSIIYIVNSYLDEKEREPLIKEAKELKETTNSNFLPTSTTGAIVHHKYYSLSYSEDNEQAEWVAYELKKNHISRNDFKRPYFEVDNGVPTVSADWRNYKNSGYDRGHFCPAGDRKFSKEAFTETFLTSNISPQDHDFNAGIWNRLEQKVRYWATKYDGVYVVTGGILNDTEITIGDEHVTVPKYFYKLVLDYNNGKPKLVAFLFPHRESNKPLYDFVTTTDKIEELTGIDFFPHLEDDIEDKLEASNNYKGWSFR